MNRSRTYGLLIAVALGVPATPARAGLVFYPDLASYNAATQANTTVTFEGISADNGYVNYPTPQGLTLSGVNFTTDAANSNGYLYVLGKGSAYLNESVLSSEYSTLNNDNIMVNLPGAYTAVGFDVGNYTGLTVTVKLSTGDTFTESEQGFPYLKFVGFTSTTPITSLEISQPTSTSDVLNVDMLRFGQAVPEPSSLVLTAVAGAVLGGLRALSRRRAGAA